MKFRISIILIIVLIFTSIASVYACDYHDSWNVRYTKYGNREGDIATVAGIAGVLAAIMGYGDASFWTGVASAILSTIGTPWNVYYQRDTHFSPDGYAFLYRTTLYENPDYTGQIGAPTCSQLYFITAAPSL